MTHIKKTAKSIVSRIRSRHGGVDRGNGFTYHQPGERHFTLDMAIAHRAAIR